MQLAGKRNVWQWLIPALTVAVLLALPAVVQGAYARRLINLAQIWIMLTLGLNFVLGYAGQLSLGHAGFFAIGAYISGLLTTSLQLSFGAALGVSIAVNAVLAILLGLPTVRLRSHYLAFATLGFSEIVRMVLQTWKKVTHGTDGVLNIPPPNLGTWVLSSEIAKYYLILVFLLGLVWVAVRFSRSRYGLAFRAINDSELAAAAMGMDTARYKLLAFVLSGVYAGIAGSLYAHLYAFLSPDAFGIDVTLSTLAMLLIGGSGTVLGPVTGGVLLTFLPEWLRGLQEYYMVVYGLGLVALIVFMPTGLVGMVRERWRRQSSPDGKGGRQRASA